MPICSTSSVSVKLRVGIIVDVKLLYVYAHKLIMICWLVYTTDFEDVWVCDTMVFFFGYYFVVQIFGVLWFCPLIGHFTIDYQELVDRHKRGHYIQNVNIIQLICSRFVC